MNTSHFKFVFGAMGCGKTARLRGDYFSKVGDNFEAIIVKPKIDTKGDRCIETRDGSKLEAKFVLGKEDNIYQLVTEYLFENTLDFIFVDEIEFLTEEQIIQINLESPEYNFKDYMELYNYVKEKLIPNKKNYVFLDEVQNVDKFQKAVDGLYIK